MAKAAAYESATLFKTLKAKAGTETTLSWAAKATATTKTSATPEEPSIAAPTDAVNAPAAKARSEAVATPVAKKAAASAIAKTKEPISALFIRLNHSRKKVALAWNYLV